MAGFWIVGALTTSNPALAGSTTPSVLIEPLLRDVSFALIGFADNYAKLNEASRRVSGKSGLLGFYRDRGAALCGWAAQYHPWN